MLYINDIFSTNPAAICIRNLIEKYVDRIGHSNNLGELISKTKIYCCNIKKSKRDYYLNYVIQRICLFKSKAY